MLELAPASVAAEAFRPIGTALLGFELFVGDVFTLVNQLLGTMSEPTLVTVRTIPVLRVIFAQLSLVLTLMNLRSLFIGIFFSIR